MSEPTLQQMKDLLNEQSDGARRAVFSMMLDTVDGSLNFKDHLEMVVFANLAWGALQNMEATAMDKAHVLSFAMGIFYWNNQVDSSLFQMLTPELQPWAYFGERCGNGAGEDMPKIMHHLSRDVLCEKDTSLLRSGEQVVNMLALSLLMRCTEYSAEEYYSTNTWLLAMGDYAVKAGFATKVADSLYQQMGIWMPEMKSYLSNCENFSLTWDDVISMAPLTPAARGTTLPRELVRN